MFHRYSPVATLILLSFAPSIESFLTSGAALIPAHQHNHHPKRSLPLFIFFKERDDKAEGKLSLLESLSSSSIQFPVTSEESLFFGLDDPICFRLLAVGDIDEVVDMCMAEYGDDLGQSPSASKLVDTASLRILIDSTCKMKIPRPEGQLPIDHAILLASNAKTNQLIGMIEVSRQPSLPTRNPGAVPMPLWGKKLYCSFRGLGPPQGWIANLLVAPPYRRKGISKFLVAAAEGVAKSWGCTSIHLHCSADEVAGRIPRLLYEGMGYERLSDDSVDLRWAEEGSQQQGPNPLENSVYIIEGVPLLYLKKELQ